MKNILLTTLDHTDDRTDIGYYYYHHDNGQKTFCTGISVAEAGTKFILSRYHIDEIIVVGNKNTVNGYDNVNRTLLRDVKFFESDIDKYSEYAFFKYRISQFFEDIELEGNDVKELLSAEEERTLEKKYSDIAKKYEINDSARDLFYYLENDNEKSDAFLKEIRSTCNDREINRLNYEAYRRMDSRHKMHILDNNRDACIRHLSTIESLHSGREIANYFNVAFDTINETKEEISLYIDFQGLGFTEAFEIHNIISVVKASIEKDINVAALIQTGNRNNRICRKIANEWERFDIQTLVSGVQVFLNFGKSEDVFSFWKKHGVNNPVVAQMFEGMKSVEEGISLCNIDMLKYGISVIRESLKRENEVNLFAYHVLKSLIEKDYGTMLEGDEISIPSLLEWTVKKGMFQQALSIVESHVPSDMVKRGIFYYAGNNQEAERVKETFNVMYWNETTKCRYQYNDIDHFIIKNYGKDFINLRQRDKTQVDRDNAAFHVRRIHIKDDNILPAFSCMEDDALLNELLFSYFQIGRLRNQVCHAAPPANALRNGEEIKQNDNKKLITDGLKGFLRVYTSACKAAEGKQYNSISVTEDEFRSYTKNHRLIPFETNDDGSLKQTVTCSFSGKEVNIQIKMLDTFETDDN